MSEKLVFEVGIRLLGLHFLLQGLPLFLITVGELLVSVEAKNGLPEKENWYRLMSSVGYLIFIVMGAWLMRGPSFFIEWLFKRDRQWKLQGNSSWLERSCLAVLLVIGTVPSLLDALTYFLLFAVSPFAGPDLETRAYFVPQLGSMLFGILLFFRGELLANWAFAERNPIAGTIKWLTIAASCQRVLSRFR